MSGVTGGLKIGFPDGGLIGTYECGPNEGGGLKEAMDLTGESTVR